MSFFHLLVSLHKVGFWSRWESLFYFIPSGQLSKSKKVELQKTRQLTSSEVADWLSSVLGVDMSGDVFACVLTETHGNSSPWINLNYFQCKSQNRHSCFLNILEQRTPNWPLFNTICPKYESETFAVFAIRTALLGDLKLHKRFRTFDKQLIRIEN